MMSSLSPSAFPATSSAGTPERIRPDPGVLSDHPIEARIGWLVVLAFMLLFGLFATLVRLDAAATADGVVSVSGNRQAVQHRTGGKIARLLIREGQEVKAGDLLVELAGDDIVASERSAAIEAIQLLAQRARLDAERSGTAVIATPSLFSTFTADRDRREGATALAQQAMELRANRAATASRKRVLAEQAQQMRSRIAGISGQIRANERQKTLFAEELTGMYELEKRGFAAKNRLRALERSDAALTGETEGLRASAAATAGQVAQAGMEADVLDSTRLREVAEEQRQNAERLGEALPRWEALRRQVEELRIRAPASGAVVGLRVHTEGGVIQPAALILEIVPHAAPLVIQAQVSPQDAEGLVPGQTAEVHFPTIHDRALPEIHGRISRLSADSFTDENSGARFFTVEVQVAPGDIALLRRDSAGSALKAGIPVQITVPLRRRTMLEYLLEPLNQALWRSGREH